MAVLPLPDFWITQLNYIGLYSLTCLGLVLLTGVAGLTSFGQAAFVGIGAYSTAWLTLNAGLSPWVTLFIGLAITAVSALIVGGITLRMSGHYLPLATIAWGLSLYYLMGNIDALREVRDRDFSGTVAAVALYHEDVTELLELGTDVVVHMYAGAGRDLADQSMEAKRQHP